MKILTTVKFEEEWVKTFQDKSKDELVFIDYNSANKNDTIITDCKILIARNRDCSEDFLSNFCSLQFLFIVSTGVEKLPFDYLLTHNIKVANTTGVSDETMSDYVIGAILNFSCNFFYCHNYKQNHYWKKFLCSEPINKKNLLILGAGRIAKSIAHKAKAFNMNVFGIKRELIGNIDNFDQIGTFDDLDRFIPLADYIVCTLPLTNETKHICNEKMFKNMKNTSVFINISRGELVNKEALCNALNNNYIKGAVLDVFETEPLDKNDELWDINNLIITPHSSGRIKDFLKYALDCFLTNLEGYKKTGNLITPIDLKRGY